MVDGRSSNTRDASPNGPLGSFKDLTHSFLLVDLHKLSGKEEEDVFRRPIKDLAQSSIVNGKVYPRVTFFQLSPKAKVMISILSKLRDSILLRRFWKENGGKALKLTAEKQEQKVLLSVDDVEELVWTPSIEQLQSLQERFLNGAISFEEIDKFFNAFKGNHQDLDKEMKLITSRSGSKVDVPELINERVQQIDQYYKLQNCIDAAQNILEFKQCLGLQGDFQLVEDLYNQVCLSCIN